MINWRLPEAENKVAKFATLIVPSCKAARSKHFRPPERRSENELPKAASFSRRSIVSND